ncbi:MAG: response regulator, partial [Patescibacteria group bacterium]
RPNLIVSDVMMPKISGFDMLDILRSTTETKDIKVIMMTALSSEDQRLRGEQLGADRYLVKSQVGIEDVVRTVHEVLGDAPMTLGVQNAFGSNAPSAVARPAPSVAPRPDQTAPVSAAPQPVSIPITAPSPTTAPAPATPVSVPVQTAPQQQPAVVTPQAAPAAPYSTPAASTLPQPTAPFSTARPAGLADRIIQPLERPEESSEPIGSLMDKELGQSPAPAFQTPAAPVVPPAPALPTPPQPAAEPLSQPAQPIQPPTVQLPPAPVQSPDHGISFEETPRSAS